jgi:hypothetical protein
LTGTTARWRRAAPWILVIGVSTAADWLARILTDFDMPRVFAAEALIFPVTAAGLGFLRRQFPASGRRTRALQTTLVWTFALAGIRSAMLALGSSYLWAIIVPVSLALLGLWGGWRRRRGTRSATHDGTGTA